MLTSAEVLKQAFGAAGLAATHLSASPTGQAELQAAAGPLAGPCGHNTALQKRLLTSSSSHNRLRGEGEKKNNTIFFFSSSFRTNRSSTRCTVLEHNQKASPAGLLVRPECGGTSPARCTGMLHVQHMANRAHFRHQCSLTLYTCPYVPLPTSSTSSKIPAGS